VSVDWYRDAVIYQLHVRAFADSNSDGTGDFEGLTSRLDYLAELGVTALWLLPFYPSPLRDDGYDIADYRTVHPDYGNIAAFKRFLAAAHARGLKVITELVINHTSDQHPWFERARRAPPGSKWRDFYVWSDDPERYGDARIIFQDFEPSNWTWDAVAGQYYWHRFYSHQPDLNFDNPLVEEAVFDVLDHWLDMGVDGVRLDAVPYLYEREGTNCENLPETHALLKRLRAHMDAHYQERMLLAEANQWPEDASAYFGDGDECHMNFNFPLMPRMFMGVQMETRAPIVDILEQTPQPPGDAQWATFLRNHDELTLEMVTDEERDLMLRAYARDEQMRINLGIRRRLAPLLGNDRRKIELLNALLFSLPGTPIMYYGDEIGMGDNVYLGDRDGVRTPMQWSADRNAGFSTCNPHRLYLPLITELGYHYENVNVESQLQSSTSLLAWMRQLVSLRRRHPVLARGDLRVLDPENQHVLAFVRSFGEEHSFLCVANLSRLAQHVELDLRAHVGNTPVEAFGRTRFAPIGEGPYQLTMAPFGFFWLVLEPNSSATAADLVTPHLSGTWEDVIRRRTALTRAIAAWLPARRWYAGKGRAVSDVTLEDVIPLRDSAPEVAFAIVRVAFTEGEDHRYSVPLLHGVGSAAGAADHLSPGDVIARLDDGLIVDAMTVPDGARAITSAALSKRQHRGRIAAAHGSPRRNGRLLTSVQDVNLLNGEQSNSSVILNGRMVAKLVRRLQPASNPDVEIPERLARVGFEHAPGLVATLEVDVPGEDGTASAVIVHDAIANEGDLWSWMAHQLSRAIDSRAESSAMVDGVDGPTLTIAELLGRRTAELHVALARHGHPADGAFAPQSFTLLSQRALLQSVRSALRATQRMLRVRAAISNLEGSEDVEQWVETLRGSPEEILRRFEPLRRSKLHASRIRIHGDLHLGQVLWTGRDVAFIDFEGEPDRPMSGRSIKRSPLVDVAGLIRSIDYAGRSAVHTAVERGVVAEGEAAGLDAWRRAWTRAMDGTMLSAYLATIGPQLVPTDATELHLLLDLFVLEKALYEIRYELGHRPDWAVWPLAAAAELIADPLVHA